MLAAERFSFLNQQDRHVGPGTGHGERGEASRQAPTRDQQPVPFALGHNGPSLQKPDAGGHAIRHARPGQAHFGTVGGSSGTAISRFATGTSTSFPRYRGKEKHGSEALILKKRHMASALVLPLFFTAPDEAVRKGVVSGKDGAVRLK